jgi:putative peptide zinc metalloprotease protein
MATLADSLVSSSARKLPVRMRPDLSARQHRYLGRSYWVVKEPVGLNYFRFQDEEWAILQMIDGASSLDEIKDRFEAEFPPQKITLEELQQFLGMLHRSGLIIADVPGQGHQLRKRRDERRRKEMLGALANILCIRFKGFDPERLLNWMYPAFRWFFAPVTVVMCLLLMASALGLVLVEFDVFRSKLPGFYQFFNPYNAFWLAVTLGASKVIHEFGHGLSCKHFGGECHEMGVMFLVLTPCLYCNVSDSWMLPSKWQRAAIGAAGMYIEAVLAAIATYIWWFTEPGLLNNLALNVMFISSVSTLLFNANPLLRYDGYYILSDLAEIPNLRQKATAITGRKMGQWFLGLEPPEDPFLPERNQILFALYSIAAVIYRWFVMLSIMYFLYKVFEPYGLKVIGQAIVATSLWGLLVMPFVKLYKFLSIPGRLDKVKKPRMYATLAGVAALVAAFFLVPLPFSVMAPLEIQGRMSETDAVHVQVPGTLEEALVAPGQVVAKDQVLARLTNVDLDIQIKELERQRNQYKSHWESLERRKFVDPQAASELPEVAKAYEALAQQLNAKLADRQRLELVAKRSGTVLPPPWRREKEEDLEGQLPTWSGTPLEKRNVGAYLQPGDMFCQIGDPVKLQADLVVDQSDIDFVRPGLKVEIKLDELPHEVYLGTIRDIATEAMRTASPRLASKGGGPVATKTDEAGMERPQSTSYLAHVDIDDTEGVIRLGVRGQAKIHADWQTLASRTWRFITQTFNFKL